jgi:hypothetical protein
MSDSATIAERDSKTGRFLPGNSGFGGRPRGAKSKLSEAFLQDLRDLWLEQGPDVLRRVARDEPAALLKVIAMLMPKDIVVSGLVDHVIDPANVLGSFRAALAALGNEAPARLPKPVKVIGARRS